MLCFCIWNSPTINNFNKAIEHAKDTDSLYMSFTGKIRKQGVFRTFFTFRFTFQNTTKAFIKAFKKAYGKNSLTTATMEALEDSLSKGKPLTVATVKNILKNATSIHTVTTATPLIEAKPTPSETEIKAATPDHSEAMTKKETMPQVAPQNEDPKPTPSETEIKAATPDHSEAMKEKETMPQVAPQNEDPKPTPSETEIKAATPDHSEAMTKKETMPQVAPQNEDPKPTPSETEIKAATPDHSEAMTKKETMPQVAPQNEDPYTNDGKNSAIISDGNIKLPTNTVAPSENLKNNSVSDASQQSDDDVSKNTVGKNATVQSQGTTEAPVEKSETFNVETPISTISTSEQHKEENAININASTPQQTVGNDKKSFEKITSISDTPKNHSQMSQIQTIINSPNMDKFLKQLNVSRDVLNKLNLPLKDPKTSDEWVNLILKLLPLFNIPQIQKNGLDVVKQTGFPQFFGITDKYIEDNKKSLNFTLNSLNLAPVFIQKIIIKNFVKTQGLAKK